MVGHLLLMVSSGMLQSLLMQVSVYNVTQTIYVHNEVSGKLNRIVTFRGEQYIEN